MWIFITMQFIPVIKPEFSASLLQPHYSVTWSFRNYSNMLICCSINISDSYQCWKQLCCFIFLWKVGYILCFGTDESSKEHLFEMEILCNIINALLSLLINLMHPWLIKSIHLFKKSLTDPKNVICKPCNTLLSHYTTVTLLKTLTKLMVPLYLVCLPDLVHLAHCAKTHSVSAGSKAFTLIVSAQISHSNNCLRTIEESSVNRHGNAAARSTVDREITHKN